MSGILIVMVDAVNKAKVGARGLIRSASVDTLVTIANQTLEHRTAIATANSAATSGLTVRIRSARRTDEGPVCELG